MFSVVGKSWHVLESQYFYEKFLSPSKFVRWTFFSVKKISCKGPVHYISTTTLFTLSSEQKISILIESTTEEAEVSRQLNESHTSQFVAIFGQPIIKS